VRFPENPARAVEESGGFVGGWNIALCECRSGTCPLENVSLAPGGNRGRSTTENNGATDDSDSGRDVGEVDVVESKRSSELSVTGR
jgi:hypothetical protein